MKRYDLASVPSTYDNWHMQERSDGEFIRYSDHASAVQEMRQTLDLLGVVQDDDENTLFACSAHHTWHHERENQLIDALKAAGAAVPDQVFRIIGIQNVMTEEERDRRENYDQEST